MMNNIMLAVNGNKCMANIFYHRNGEFKLQLPREELGKFLVIYGGKIEINFHFNMKWSEMILAHLVTELRSMGFSHITLICPYLPFGRADKPEREDGCIMAIITTFFKMLKKIGINEIVTYDFHLANIGNSVEGIIFKNIGFSQIWEEKIADISHKHIDDKFLVFSPDSGAIGRGWQTCNLLSAYLPSNPLFCRHMVFSKTRTQNGLQLYGLNEYARNPSYQDRICIIVDDIIDSGKTMLAAIEKVREFNPKHIYVLVTHLLNEKFECPSDVIMFCKFVNGKETDE